MLPTMRVGHGEYVRLVMDAQCQMAFLRHAFPGAHAIPRDGSSSLIWLETEAASYPAGSPGFVARVGSIIRQRGLIANLSLRENLLLFFLYHQDRQALRRAEEELEDVAEWLGLASQLDERAGERPAYTHALVSLGRCLLARPAMIIAQEAHIGMAPERLMRFRRLALEALERLGSGLVYLSASEHEGSGLRFAHTLVVDQGHEMLASGRWDTATAPEGDGQEAW